MSSLVKTTLVALLAFSYAAASPMLEARQSCGEGTQRVCYGAPDGTPQNIDPDDLEYLAASIRNDARKDPNKLAFLNMLPNSNFQCEEWTIASEGTVLVLVKHTSARLNTTVLYEDIANTLDGGEKATADQKKSSILGCGKNGGQLGLVYDKNNKAYNTETYKAWKATPSGLVIKVVHPA
ncbi:hypothetical protein B0T25DRAFT_593013 [Lasiosphaeria hispida]|uniref:Ecp2 effector protein domain-containing protein n=1 Tax=Lasiosphaeria hispida TaxID=260671 RepID=A0AAJ0HCK7_9PEZI|nr:hypothetical protein B0T25DRAFT_593013 [Lasiosphaeria hispida]